MQYLIQAVIDGIMIGSLYALATGGLVIIWGIMEIVNFAQAEFLMLSMYISYWFFILFGIDPILCIPIAFITIFLLGAVIQRSCIQPVLNAPVLTQVAVTFALLLILRNAALIMWGPDPRSIITWYSDKSLVMGGIFFSYPKLASLIITIVSFGIFYLFLIKTNVGIALRATAQNRLAAQLLGIDVHKMYILAFGLGTGFAAVAGVLFSTIYSITPEAGVLILLIIFVVVVLGGFRSLFGTIVGGLIIGITESVSALFISPSMKDIPVYILFFIILMVRPTGLFGRKGGI